MENALISFLKSLVGYLILAFISVNLIGLALRGVFQSPDFHDITTDDKYLIKEIRKTQFIDKILTVFSFLLIGLYFFLLYYFINYGIVIVAAILMIARIPHLLYEIRTGEKITNKLISNTKSGTITSILTWLAFIILWIALYK
jgi:hypothetical protein